MKNFAFIDGQNLNLWVREDDWFIDFEKFRIYLKEKYKVSNAYYFLGHMQEENNWLYTKLQEAGFIVVFKKQMVDMKSNKKWNIDSDLIFHIMKLLIDKPDKFDKIVLVSGDGDFKILVDYLIKKDRFEKILFPNTKYASSLYKDLTSHYYARIISVKSKIEYIRQ